LQSPAYSKKGFTGMKQFVILLLLLSLFSALFIGCDEQNPALSPDGSGNQEDSFDDTYDTDISKPTGNITKPPAENEDTNSSGENEDSDTTAPATLEYGQDLRLAESPDDPIFTCLGASNTSLAGRVAIQATYQDQFHVVSVWVNAFAGCTAITEISIAEGILYINQCAFCDCTSLTDIYLPSSLLTIRDFAFAGCDNLTDIHFFGTRQDWQLIDLKDDWAPTAEQYVIHCTDGDIVVNQN
jgi:hypothetical protein